ncbi:T9SS C-terminal target domain-containing protein [bacterium]|nr:MAG: T9SS C-terminal target domain-containing protein [bacterium]
MRQMLRVLFIHIFILYLNTLCAQSNFNRADVDSIPSDLPLPKITFLRNTADGYIFAAVPYWGQGRSYLVVYDNDGKPVFYRRASSTCTDFKMQESGLLTYFDYASKKYYALDSSLSLVDSFWVKNGYTTDEHDLKILQNGSVLLIGSDIRFYDMSQYIQGGDRNASVVVNVIQEQDKNKNVVFEWKSYEHYGITDVGPEVNLLDQAFVHAHINSVDVDLDGNLVISARNLDEITKIDRKTGTIIWRFGGKNNQFRYVNDSIGFSAQHAVSILQNGNVLLYDNGLFHKPSFSRAVEYKLDPTDKTAVLNWSYRNTPDIASVFWGNAQRLGNGNTFISWGFSDIAATEVDPAGNKVFEMTFPKDVFSYRVFRFPFRKRNLVSDIKDVNTTSDFTLHQNFPNPLSAGGGSAYGGNSSTTITYNLPSRSRVRLEIFNLLGQRITALVESEQSGGSHSVVWNASVTSGVYICRLEATALDNPTKRFLQVQKLMLLR